MGVTGAEDARNEHAGKLEIADVFGLTSHALDRIDRRTGGPDHFESACGVLLLGHGASYACNRRDAVMTDSRMRLYAAQRHRLPLSARRASSSVGRGIRSRNAFVVMIWPDVQNPHWKPLCWMNACWIGCSS